MPETRSQGIAREALAIFRALNPEQRIAGVGAVLLLVSTFGPFSFVEAAEVLIALAVLALLRARALGKRFHLPLGDGTVIAAAGAWAALLIVARLFDRPLGQNLLALACAAILVFAGLRERAKRPADDLPAEPVHHAPPERAPAGERPAEGPEPEPAATPASEPPGPGPATRAARRLAPAPAEDTEATSPLPPERKPAEPQPGERPAEGEQLTLPGDEPEG
jgi:hypothetical protein